MFHKNDSFEIRTLVKNLFLERFRYDKYINRCDVYWLNLLFVNALRDSYEYSQFSSSESGPDYAPLLRYIQSHYQTITLEQLSNKFNYSVPYLSKIIKEMTGENFTKMIRKQKWKKQDIYFWKQKIQLRRFLKKPGIIAQIIFPEFFVNITEYHHKNTEKIPVIFHL